MVVSLAEYYLDCDMKLILYCQFHSLLNTAVGHVLYCVCSLNTQMQFHLNVFNK